MRKFRGKLAWKGFSTGPDEEMLMDPAKTMTWTDGKLAPWRCEMRSATTLRPSVSATPP